mgnify:CR=1 FL=1
MNNRTKYKPWAEASSHYIREFAHNNGEIIYEWMKKNGIGESMYGKYLDSLGSKPGVFYHRLYGHHPVYDFPLDSPENIPDFLEHVLVSDLFTKQGLPIIPGQILNNEVVKNVFDGVSLEWNFVNGFDLLAGTLAVYNSYKISADYFNQKASIEELNKLGKRLGITTIHVALALSTCNPLLLISSAVSMAGTLVGTLNNPYKVYFEKLTDKYKVTTVVESYDIDKVVDAYDIDNVIESYGIENRDYI